MELLISASKSKPKQESESKFTIAKRYLTPKNKKAMDKVNRIQGRADKKTALQRALAKEAQRYKDQVVALRTKHKTALTAELEKAKKGHAAKVEALRKAAGKKTTPKKDGAKQAPTKAPAKPANK